MEREDPAGAGAVAGAVAGSILAVAYAGLLFFFREQVLDAVEAAVGPGSDVSPTAIFWIGVGSALLFWLGTGLFVGSVLGVVYDRLGRPGEPVLIGLVTFVGLLTGVVTATPAPRIAAVAVATAAWLCYVPAFVYLFRDERAGGGATTTSR